MLQFLKRLFTGDDFRCPICGTAVRLSGILPTLGVCDGCGVFLQPGQLGPKIPSAAEMHAAIGKESDRQDGIIEAARRKNQQLAQLALHF